MNGFRAELLTMARAGHGELSPGVLAGVGRRRGASHEERVSRGERASHGEAAHGGCGSHGERDGALDTALRCVSSGYLIDGCSCQARIPAAVARRAWRRELELGRPC